MRKHHLLLAYIFIALFSVHSLSLDSLVKDEPSGGGKLLGKLKSAFSHKEKASPPNKISPALYDHLVQVKETGAKNQEAAFYSETFPGSDEIGVIKEGGNRLEHPYGVPNASTNCGVSVCSAFEQAFLAFIDLEGQVKVVQTKDLIHWSKPASVLGDMVQTARYVNCFTFNYQPYVTCGNLLTHSKDAKTWEKPTPLPFGDAAFAVTMLQDRDTLVAACSGKDNCVYLTSSVDAINWKPLRKVDNWKTQLPVSLFIRWNSPQIGWVSNNGIVFTETVVTNVDDRGWDRWALRATGDETPLKTKHPISMSSLGNNTWLAYLGENNKAYETSTKSPTDWSEPSLLKNIKTNFPVCVFEHTFYRPDYRRQSLVIYIDFHGLIYIKSPSY
jgi:hypothetical protein